MARDRSLSSSVVALISSLVLDALVHAPAGAVGHSVVACSVGAISETDTKLGEKYLSQFVSMCVCVV